MTVSQLLCPSPHRRALTLYRSGPGYFGNYVPMPLQTLRGPCFGRLTDRPGTAFLHSLQYSCGHRCACYSWSIGRSCSTKTQARIMALVGISRIFHLVASFSTTRYKTLDIDVDSTKLFRNSGSLSSPSSISALWAYTNSPFFFSIFVSLVWISTSDT